MKFLGKLFQNPKQVVVLITVFVLLLLLLFSVKSRGSDLTVEGGAALLRGETPTLGLTITWPQAGPVDTDYELGFQLVGQSDGDSGPQPNAIMVHGALVDGWKNFEAGLGFYAHNVDWEYNCDFGFHLLARYRFTERLGMQWRHYSSAGSCRPNKGRDLLTLGWRF